jgi:hypothetical protein
LVDRNDRGVEADQVADLALERLGDQPALPAPKPCVDQWSARNASSNRLN